MTERLKTAVIYSIALAPRCFKWKMLNFSGPNALLFLQLLISLITRSAVNVCAISNVSHEDVCLPNFEVLNLVANCLDDENEIPLRVIASFSALRFSLPSIPFIVFNRLVTSVFWSKVSTKSLHYFRSLHRCVSGCLYLVLSVQSIEVESLLRRSSRLVITSSISASTGSSWIMWCPVEMCSDAALSRIGRKIFSSLW